jgi:hypothetical protein
MDNHLTIFFSLLSSDQDRVSGRGFHYHLPHYYLRLLVGVSQSKRKNIFPPFSALIYFTSVITNNINTHPSPLRPLSTHFSLSPSPILTSHLQHRKQNTNSTNHNRTEAELLLSCPANRHRVRRLRNRRRRILPCISRHGTTRRRNRITGRRSRSRSRSQNIPLSGAGHRGRNRVARVRAPYMSTRGGRSRGGGGRPGFIGGRGFIGSRRGGRLLTGAGAGRRAW